MNDVFAEILRLKLQGRRAALCTIISSKGSLPMSGKAKMLVGEDGTMVGTVGGGCLEADVWAEAQRVLKKDISKIASFILTEQHAGESGLNCGGKVVSASQRIVSSKATPTAFRSDWHTESRLLAKTQRGQLSHFEKGQIPHLLRQPTIHGNKACRQ